MAEAQKAEESVGGLFVVRGTGKSSHDRGMAEIRKLIAENLKYLF